MLTLSFGTIIVLLAIMGLVCAVGGYAFAQERQRRSGGGKTAAELHEELGEYKSHVTDHFQTTANLLNEMTEQYRAVYEHMARGASELCEAESATAQIESLRTGLLLADDSTVPTETASVEDIEEDADGEPPAPADDTLEPKIEASDPADIVAEGEAAEWNEARDGDDHEVEMDEEAPLADGSEEATAARTTTTGGAG